MISIALYGTNHINEAEWRFYLCSRPFDIFYVSGYTVPFGVNLLMSFANAASTNLE